MPATLTRREAQRLGLLGENEGKRSTKSARAAAILRAPADERVGLIPLLRAGWSLWYSHARGAYQLYIGTMDVMQHTTGWHAELRNACNAAKRIHKECGL